LSPPPLSLKARALQWLAQREQSRAELRRKLMRLGRQRAAAAAQTPRPESIEAADLVDDAAKVATEVETLLDWLEANRYLSQARFVETRVNARAARYGNLRIHRELAQHGAAVDDATAAQLQDSEMARARAVWVRRFGTEPASDAADRAKQMRFLAGRGFSAETIRRVLRGESDDDLGA
jgi:regulatory protein